MDTPFSVLEAPFKDNCRIRLYSTILVAHSSAQSALLTDVKREKLQGIVGQLVKPLNKFFIRGAQRIDVEGMGAITMMSTTYDTAVKFLLKEICALLAAAQDFDRQARKKIGKPPTHDNDLGKIIGDFNVALDLIQEGIDLDDKFRLSFCCSY